MHTKNIKNIIFDLGGVFIDVDYQKTKQAFVELGIANFDNFYHQSFSNPLFEQLEKGLISPESFYDNFRVLTQTQFSDREIETAWNAMLGSYRKSSIAILPSLKQRYNIYLLSNTNAIHYQAILHIHKAEYGHAGFDLHFHKTYYSHIIYERKPEKVAYEMILEENGLKKEETLFVDDTMKNIDGARLAGLEVFFLEKDVLVEDALMGTIL